MASMTSMLVSFRAKVSEHKAMKGFKDEEGLSLSLRLKRRKEWYPPFGAADKLLAPQAPASKRPP
jgi:hypothetical protein